MSWLSKAWKKYVTGSYYKDKANDLAAQEDARQAQVRQSMINYLDQVNAGLAQQKQDYLNTVLNANSTGNAYLNNYLAKINGIADTNYNQGVTALRRNIANSENAIRNQIANRGISGAGVDFKNLVNSQGALARGISALQAQRMRDNADVAAEKYNTSSNINATNFNRLQSYYNYNPQMSQTDLYKYSLMGGELNPSQYTQNLMSEYQNKANNPALGSLVSAGVNALAGNWLGAAGSLFRNKKTTSNYSTQTYLPQNYVLQSSPVMNNPEYNWRYYGGY